MRCSRVEAVVSAPYDEVGEATLPNTRVNGPGTGAKVFCAFCEETASPFVREDSTLECSRCLHLLSDQAAKYLADSTKEAL